MPLTKRLVEKGENAVNTPIPPSITPTISVTPSITATISVTPSVTPSVTVSPSVTPSITLTPTPSPSTAYCYFANMYNCYTDPSTINCGSFTGQCNIYNNISNFIVGNYYTGSNHIIYQPIRVTTDISNPVIINGGDGYLSCTLACSSSYNQ